MLGILSKSEYQVKGNDPQITVVKDELAKKG